MFRLSRSKISFTIIILLIVGNTNYAQTYTDNTVGLLLNSDLSFEGYTLFIPKTQKTTYLINNAGELLHSWESATLPGHTIYLNEDGTLYKASQVEDDPIKTHIAAGGSGGKIERYNWDNDLIWEFEYSDLTKRQHHDFQVLPNGNVLLIAWEVKSKEEAIQAGRDPSSFNIEELWPDHIVEVKPVGSSGGEIVWEWHVWDHLIQDFDPTKSFFGVVDEHPELVDLNYIKTTNQDWNHINSINYNSDLDQILLSVWAFDEIWVIDHSTSTEEAKGHNGGNHGMGGDLLYRWGNPLAYKKGELTDKKLFQQHNAHWIPSGLPNTGKIMIFNNGTNRPDEQYSSIEILNPVIDMFGSYKKNIENVFEPNNFDYTYTSPIRTDFFSARFSSGQQLPNGNLLICKGPQGEFLEIDSNEEIVWNYVNPVDRDGPLQQGDSPEGGNNVFRVFKYSVDYPAFIGKTLTPQGNIELPSMVLAINKEKSDQIFNIYPNPVIDNFQIIALSEKVYDAIIYNLRGEPIRKFKGNNIKEIDVSGLSNGAYLVSINKKVMKKFIIAK
jgi:hypothetical protein